MVFMISSGHILKVNKLLLDENGARILSELSTDDLTSSEMWNTAIQTSYHEFVDYVSIYCADCSGNDHTEAIKKAFIRIPPEVMPQAVSKIHEESTSLSFESMCLSIPVEEKEYPLAKLFCIQECMILI
jgi:hypothetical protein